MAETCHDVLPKTSELGAARDPRILYTFVVAALVVKNSTQTIIPSRVVGVHASVLMNPSFLGIFAWSYPEMLSFPSSKQSGREVPEPPVPGRGTRDPYNPRPTWYIMYPYTYPFDRLLPFPVFD